MAFHIGFDERDGKVEIENHFIQRGNPHPFFPIHLHPLSIESHKIPVYSVRTRIN